ncbi:LiaF transmembrane domain-containing protein [Tuberibacillus sp. Marseille-P3662]|uniref:LiaF transmembrane domain-containing protein n=1 Tax=Tuberibacillus sp. Marseille-P3662 TaxID=1965358 RepID=UPI000A1CCC21|nr:hypothetical protein [Tuberibacillus sp. Marseille-P3662]
MTGKVVAGLILLTLGIITLFGMLGIHLGGIISLILGVVLTYYGWKHIQNQHPILGWIVLIIGLMLLVGSLPFMIAAVLSIGCIYLGWRLMKHPDNRDKPAAEGPEVDIHFDDHNDNGEHFDMEWNKIMKNRGH